MAHRTLFMIWQALAVLTRGDKASCSECAAIEDWNDEQFEQCNVWGDPHISDSWSVNGRFDFNGVGVYRYAHIDSCGGGFKLDAFQCQHSDWKHSAILYVGIELNNGAKVFVNSTHVSTSGSVSVTGAQGSDGEMEMTNPRDGVNILSDDSCIRINVNAVNLRGDLHATNGIKIRAPQDAVTDKGICGGAKQWEEHVVRGQPDFVFSIDQWRYMCGACSALGGLHPPNCPSPYFGQFDLTPGGEFLRPFEKTDERECVSLHDGDIVQQLEDNGKNSVAYAILEKSMSCRDFCHNRSSQCVDVRDNVDFAPCSFSTNVSKKKAKADCDSTEYYDLNCICAKPDLSAPGPDKRFICDDRVDAAGNAFTLEDAIQLCKAKAPFLHNAQWDRKGCKNDGECRIDFILGACVSDVCNEDPINRVAVAKNAGDQDPSRSPKESADRCVADRLGHELCRELTKGENCSFDPEAVMQEKAELCEDTVCEDASLLQRSEGEEVGLLQRRNVDVKMNLTTSHCSHRVHFCQRVCHSVLATTDGGKRKCMQYCDNDSSFAHVRDILKSCC